METNPKEIERAYRTINRRTLILGGAQLVLVAGLGHRMHYLQIEQSDEFRLLAEKNRINIRLIAPIRGKIFDKDGRIIADNAPSYRIVAVREEAEDIYATINKLGQIIELDKDFLSRALEELDRHPPFVQVTIAERVNWKDVATIAVNSPALPGIKPEVGFTRVYPYRKDFAHIVGYVGPVSDFDLKTIKEPDQVLRMPRFQIGKVGLEAKKEDVLRGKAGSKRVEVNAAGRVMRELELREGQSGADVQITIDAKLQAYVQARLGEQSASAIVIDLVSGGLLAIASSPSYDPNKFVTGISTADYKTLLQNQFRPLASKSVQGIYPPGSTFKMIVALAALEDQLISPTDTVHCPGYFEISGRKFYCWKQSGHGQVDLYNAIKQSCDVFFFSLAEKIGQDRIVAMAKKFGLGIKHDIPMSAVASGLVPNQDWKRRIHSENWMVGDTVNASIGQGFMLASPLQLAVMTARLATGKKIIPHIIKTIDGIHQPNVSAEPLDLNNTNLQLVRQAMYAVSNERRGTAYHSRIINEDKQLAGKTGTSQVRNISAKERSTGVRSNADLPWEQRDHALFVNFAPFTNPRIAVAVVVEHGGSGSSTAAPIARDITLQVLYDGLPPLSAYPSRDREQIKEQQERIRDFIPLAETDSRERA
ncbi:MAG: penicillin-binding protein 2 [Aestuariivita sp.]|nr:penicillin-binding protein 2 [Aestuariivita sp.]